MNTLLEIVLLTSIEPVDISVDKCHWLILPEFFCRCWNQLWLICLKDAMYQIQMPTLSVLVIPNYMQNIGVSCRCFWRKCWPRYFHRVQTNLPVNHLQHLADLEMVERSGNSTRCPWRVLIWSNCITCTTCGYHDGKFIQLHTVCSFWISWWQFSLVYIIKSK